MISIVRVQNKRRGGSRMKKIGIALLACSIFLFDTARAENPSNTPIFERIGLNEMIAKGYSGENVHVAILDTGVSEHIDLENTVKENRYYCYAWRLFGPSASCIQLN